MMRFCIGIGAVLLSASVGLADPMADARDQLRQAYPDVQFLVEGRQLAQVCGTTFGYGLSAEQSADQFVRTHAGVFGVAPAELQPGNAFDDRYTLPLLYDEPTGTYKATLVYYRQYKDAYPVYGADMRLLVQNQPGYPLVLANSTLYNLSDFTPPPDVGYEAEGAAYEAAAAFEPGLIDFTPAELVIWPDPQGKPQAPKVALTFVGAGLSPSGEPKRWRFVCDASSGQILHTENLIFMTDVSGSVSGAATSGPKAEQCAPEFSTRMRYAKVSISGGATAYTDASGNFTIPNDGSDPVTVQSFMSGQYFNVDNVAGAEETLTANDVVPPGPVTFVHNLANSDELVRAQVNGYVQANVVRDFCLANAPDYPVISTQTNFPVYVNRTNGYCPGNAWYDGGSINFCRAASGYTNTAFSEVVHHEYGHHMVEMGGSGQGQYGEGAGDCNAVLITDTSKLAVGFYVNDCTNGIRDANNTKMYPCNGEIHDCGQLLSGCIWSTRNQLILTEPVNYRAILSKLWVNSIPLHGPSDLITPAIYTTFIALDNTYYGGAHAAEIAAGFGAHNMAPCSPQANDLCANAVSACPGQMYSGCTGSASSDGTTTCGASNGSPDVWYSYTPATSGSAHFTLCAGTNYDSVLSIHSGCPGTSGNTLACNDDACGQPSNPPSEITLNVSANTTYLIRISGSSGAAGNYGLTIEGPSCTAPNYTLTSDVSPSGAGSIVLDPPGGSYPSDTDVQVTANPSTGYHFDHWTGDLGGSTNPTTILMDGDKSVTAVFALNQYTLSVNTSGQGSVALDPPGGLYDYGTSVQLTANPATNWYFDQWSGDLSGSTDPTTLLMDTDHAVMASFGLRGDMNCDGAVNFGDINPFVLFLSDFAAWQAGNPGCPPANGDVNQDGRYPSFGDINPFVALLSGG